MSSNEINAINFNVAITQNNINTSISGSDYNLPTTYRMKALDYDNVSNGGSYTTTPASHTINAHMLNNWLYYKTDGTDADPNDNIRFAFFNGKDQMHSTNEDFGGSTIPKIEAIIQSINLLFRKFVGNSTNKFHGKTEQINPCNGFTINHTDRIAGVGQNQIKSYSRLVAPDTNKTKFKDDYANYDTTSTFNRHWVKMVAGQLFGVPSAATPIMNDANMVDLIGKNQSGTDGYDFGQQFVDSIVHTRALNSNWNASSNTSKTPLEIDKISHPSRYNVVKNIYDQLVALDSNRFNTTNAGSTHIGSSLEWKPIIFKKDDYITFRVSLNGYITIADNSSSSLVTGLGKGWKIIQPGSIIDSSVLWLTPNNSDGVGKYIDDETITTNNINGNNVSFKSTQDGYTITYQTSSDISAGSYSKTIKENINVNNGQSTKVRDTTLVETVDMSTYGKLEWINGYNYELDEIDSSTGIISKRKITFNDTNNKKITENVLESYVKGLLIEETPTSFTYEYYNSFNTSTKKFDNTLTQIKYEQTINGDAYLKYNPNEITKTVVAITFDGNGSRLYGTPSTTVFSGCIKKIPLTQLDNGIHTKYQIYTPDGNEAYNAIEIIFPENLNEIGYIKTIKIKNFTYGATNASFSSTASDAIFTYTYNISTYTVTNTITYNSTNKTVSYHAEITTPSGGTYLDTESSTTFNSMLIESNENRVTVTYTNNKTEIIKINSDDIEINITDASVFDVVDHGASTVGDITESKTPETESLLGLLDISLNKFTITTDHGFEVANNDKPQIISYEYIADLLDEFGIIKKTTQIINTRSSLDGFMTSNVDGDTFEENLSNTNTENFNDNVYNSTITQSITNIIKISCTSVSCTLSTQKRIYTGRLEFNTSITPTKVDYNDVSVPYGKRVIPTRSWKICLKLGPNSSDDIADITE